MGAGPSRRSSRRPPNDRASTGERPGVAEPERSLLDAVGRRDSGAFWRLWQAHSDDLFVVCLREMGGHRADAEDALQQSMLKALEKLPPIAPGIVSARGWLIRMTANLCRDIHRARARAARAEAHLRTLSEGGPPDPGHVDTTPATAADPRSLIARLPGRLRDVMNLRLDERMTYKAIAARLGLSHATVRKRAQEARALLRALSDPLTREQAVTRAHRAPRPVTPPPAAVARTVSVRLPSGARRDVEIVVVDHRPGRERQKIATLRAYAARHPGGWKRRLRLADLLYATGQWIEAAEHYRDVLGKRAWLTAVGERLEGIARVIATDASGANSQNSQKP